MTTTPLLTVDNLDVTFKGKDRKPFRAVDGVSFSVSPGEIVGLVGESGSGKSVTSLAIMGLLPRRGTTIGGSVKFAGTELVGKSFSSMSSMRGKDLAMVFQDPMTSLNPVVPIGLQVTEVLRAHTDVSKSEARDQAEELLRKVGIPDPARRLGEYPHQLSGGMRQRALIATALACKPRLLICDEPTTALDVTIQAQVVELLKDLVADTGTAMIMITHDLGIVAGLCDQVNVMYSGRIVERASRTDLFASPRHRYTEGLLASIPRLDEERGQPLTPIPGTPRDTISWSDGCAFAPRCTHRTESCLSSNLPIDHDTSAGGRMLRCVNPASPKELTL